jgi:hypothetical protein
VKKTFPTLPISADVTLLGLQNEIKVPLFLFASHSFLANNLHFMVKLIDKAIVINGKHIRIRRIFTGKLGK